MKTFKLVVALGVLINVLLLSACQNTLNGMHQDWRQGTQSVADEVNKS